MNGSKAKVAEKKLKVLVLGGNGFIGRQIVKFLSDAEVTVGTRKRNTKPNEISVRMHKVLNPAQWQNLIQGFDVVINSVGILRERKRESYADVHTNSVAALANACQALNIRLIHISAIGLSANAKSRFITSKYYGEQAILNSGADAVIVRPSLLDGEGGYGAKWFRKVALWPVQFVMQSKGLVAPLQVSDLGEAVANIARKPQLKTPNIVELGGETVMSIPEYLDVLRASKGLKPALQISIPKPIVRITSHLFDVMNWTPLSFGHFELMQGLNVPEENWLPILLTGQPSELGWNFEVSQICIAM